MQCFFLFLVFSAVRVLSWDNLFHSWAFFVFPLDSIQGASHNRRAALRDAQAQCARDCSRLPACWPRVARTKMSQRGAKMRKDGAKMRQCGAKIDQCGAKMKAR